MKFKRILGITIPVVSMIVAGAVLSIGKESKAPIATQAADYSTSARDFELNQDGSVSITFTPYKSDLDMRGWLLCLLSSKPNYNLDSRKLIDSDNTHPYTYSNCAHYFYTNNVSTTGRLTITWAANEGDQKEDWHEDGGFVGAEGHTLADYLASQDWHIVVGPRHYKSNWETSSNYGAGYHYIWENCDYYVGRKNALVNGIDGQTYIDLSQFNSWEDANDKFAVYYWKGENNAWSEFATATEHEHIYLAQYSLDFVPTDYKVVRLKSTCTAPNWDDKDNEGTNHSFHEVGAIGVTDWWASWEYGFATIDFSASDKVYLDCFKRNAKTHSENFNQRFPLSEGQVFNVGFGGSSYSNFEINASLASCFDTTSVSGKLTVLTTGIYALYFDTDAHSLYITTTALAEADEWAEPFLGNSCTDTKNNWSTYQTEYGKLSSEAQEYLFNIPHYAHDEVIQGWTNLAMQRYDYLIQFFGYNDYIKRANQYGLNNQNVVMKVISSESTVTAIVVVVTTSIFVAAIGAFFIFRRKKQINN